MEISKTDLEYDPIIDGIIQEAMMDIAIQNEEFRQWLIENGFVTLHEDTQQQWYLKWKQATATGMKATLDKFLTYSNKQINKNRAFLEQNKEMILNSKKYPVQGSTVIQNAPLYDQALQRISRPISNGLIGINLEKVEVSGQQENQVSMGEAEQTVAQGGTVSQATANSQHTTTEAENLWLKKMLVPGYTGKVSFTEGAKAYFYGSDSRVNMNIETVQQLLPKAYQFCYNYNRSAHSTQTDLNGIISFINKDQLTNQQQTQTATAQQAQQAGQSNGMASTNPTANTAVNAAVEAEYFYNRYGLNEVEQTTVTNVNRPITPARSVNTSQQANQSKQSYTQNRVDTTTNQQNQSNQQTEDNNAKKQEKAKTKQEQSQSQLLAKKKQAAVELVRDAFNAKLTAMGLIYRDFIKIMNNHILSYKQK